jgi:hypothetical protein
MQLALPFTRIEAIAEVSEIWLSKNSRWMKRAERELSISTPYSREMIRACLQRTFRNYDEANLLDWISKEKIPSSKRKITHIFSPSTVFAATWQAAVATWISGGKVVIKPSRHEKKFATLLQKSIPARLQKHLPISVSYTKSLPPKGNVVVYGSDETLLEIKRHLSKRSKLIGFGSRFSLGVISSYNRGLIKKAALDVILYETQGCLSPQCFFVRENVKLNAVKFAKLMAAEIKNASRNLSAKKVPTDDLEMESFWQHWKFRESQKRVQIFDNRVILDREKSFKPLGSKRVVLVKPFLQWKDIQKQIGSWNSKISTIACSDSDIQQPLQKIFKKRSDIRYCTLGEMHEPLPSWKNGGVNLLNELK